MKWFSYLVLPVFGLLLAVSASFAQEKDVVFYDEKILNGDSWDITPYSQDTLIFSGSADSYIRTRSTIPPYGDYLDPLIMMIKTDGSVLWRNALPLPRDNFTGPVVKLPDGSIVGSASIHLSQPGQLLKEGERLYKISRTGEIIQTTVLEGNIGSLFIGNDGLIYAIVKKEVITSVIDLGTWVFSKDQIIKLDKDLQVISETDIKYRKKQETTKRNGLSIIGFNKAGIHIIYRYELGPDEKAPPGTEVYSHHSLPKYYLKYSILNTKGEEMSSFPVKRQYADSQLSEFLIGGSSYNLRLLGAEDDGSLLGRLSPRKGDLVVCHYNSAGGLIWQSDVIEESVEINDRYLSLLPDGGVLVSYSLPKSESEDKKYKLAHISPKGKILSIMNLVVPYTIFRTILIQNGNDILVYSTAYPGKKYSGYGLLQLRIKGLIK